MNRKIRTLLLIMMVILGLAGSTAAVYATEETTEDTTVQTESTQTVTTKKGWNKIGKYKYYYKTSTKMVTGWKKISGKTYYFRKKKDGAAPKGSMVTGFYTVGGKTFYFNKNGVLQTGWQTINKQNYYFKKNGALGTQGAMATGMVTISGRKYCFAEDGHAYVGWTTYKNKRYFFSNSTKLGIRGRALVGWKKIGKYYYYFGSTGILQKNKWISGKYYVDGDGRRLISCVTPDGYVVNAKGEKGKLAKGWIKQDGKYYYYVSGKKTVGWKTISGKKYYFDENGVRQTGWLTVGGYTYYLKSAVMQTGWQTIGGKIYYFNMDGKMAVNTTVEGVVIGADGVAPSLPEGGKEKILIIAGHGMGDVGAIGEYGSTTYYEYKYTRQFATLVYNAIKAKNANLTIEMYDQNYDCYQVLSGKQEGPIPTLTDYDYILEIHFNATVESSKDPDGDGNYKGVGMYVNSAKSDVTLDKNIVKAISNTGFRIWGGSTGIFKSATLFNAKTCQAAGVSYGLLETAFIDDKDDMKFYNNNKAKMAEGVASAIVAYFQ